MVLAKLKYSITAPHRSSAAARDLLLSSASPQVRQAAREIGREPSYRARVPRVTHRTESLHFGAVRAGHRPPHRP